MTEKENFYISELCTSRRNCNICRARHEGRNWRKSLRGIYRLASVDFECPEGKYWIEDRATTDQSDAAQRKPCSNCGKKAMTISAIAAADSTPDSTIEDQAVTSNTAVVNITDAQDSSLRPDAASPLFGETRASCIECVEKHIGAAMVLLSETKNGYPHYLLAIGHLHEAEEESQSWPEVAVSIREARKDLQQSGKLPEWNKITALLELAHSA